MNAMNAMNASALAGMRQRLQRVVPRHLEDCDVVALCIAATLRHRQTVLRTLYSPGVAQYLADDKQCDAVGIRPEELSGLTLGSRGEHTKVESLEREDPLHATSIRRLREALQTTLTPDRSSKAWARPATRCAAAVATRMIDSKSQLEALFGAIAKVDSRRLGVQTEELECQEEEDDAHLFSTCVAVDLLARTLAN